MDRTGLVERTGLEDRTVLVDRTGIVDRTGLRNMIYIRVEAGFRPVIKNSKNSK